MMDNPQQHISREEVMVVKAFSSLGMTAGLLAGALLMPVNAQQNLNLEEKRGYIIGATHALCGMNSAGFIDNEMTEKMLNLMASVEDSEMPKYVIDQAFAYLRQDETISDCPFPKSN